MGLSSLGHAFCLRMDVAIEGVTGAVKLVDDTLVQVPMMAALDNRVRLGLNKCQAINLTLSPDKFKVGSVVTFAGHIIAADGKCPDRDTLKAICEFPPNAGTGKGVVFQWFPEHQAAFDGLKTMATSNLAVQPFDVSKPIEVHTDASHFGRLVFALIQLDGNRPRLIECGSRCLTPRKPIGQSWS